MRNAELTQFLLFGHEIEKGHEFHPVHLATTKSIVKLCGFGYQPTGGLSSFRTRAIRIFDRQR